MKPLILGMLGAVALAVGAMGCGQADPPASGLSREPEVEMSSARHVEKPRRQPQARIADHSAASSESLTDAEPVETDDFANRWEVDTAAYLRIVAERDEEPEE